MNKRSTCIFCVIKELSAEAIHSELIAMVEPDAISHPTVCFMTAVSNTTLYVNFSIDSFWDFIAGLDPRRVTRLV
jgi:hypothetical protein